MLPNSALNLAALFWSARTAWPKGNSSNVFLASALDEVGRAVVDGWNGDEPQRFAETDMVALRRDAIKNGAQALRREWERQTLKVPSTLADWGAGDWRNVRADEVRATPDWHVRLWREEVRHAAAAQRLAEADAVSSRLVAAMDWIQAQGCEGGRLVTRGRLVGVASAYAELPAFIWNIEGPWPSRFADCTAVFRGLQYYLFLDRASLDECLKGFRAAKPRKPRANSLEEADAPLLVEMRSLIKAGKASGAQQASVLLVAKAKGSGTDYAKAKRLERRYGEQYGEK